MCKVRGCYYYRVQMMGYHAKRTVCLQHTGRIYTAIQVINQNSLPIYYTPTAHHPRYIGRDAHLRSLEQLKRAQVCVCTVITLVPTTTSEHHTRLY